MPLSPFTIWTDPDRKRYFLLPDSAQLPSGTFAIRAPLGKHQSVDPASLRSYEMTAEHAKVWVASEITGILSALPKGPIDAGSKILAAAHMVRTLPQIIETSAEDPVRAAAGGAQLDNLLAEAGIETHSAFAHLPARIAALSSDPDVRARRDAIAKEMERVSRQVDIPTVRRFLEQLGSRIGNPGSDPPI